MRRPFGGPTSMTREQRIRPAIRAALLLAPWSITAALIACTNSPIRFSDFRDFPYGLTWFVFPSDWHSSRAVDSATLAVGWLLFLALTVLCYRQARPIRYAICYVALCGLLVLNIIGVALWWAEIGPMLKM
jgi:hypothetical protein